jgi:hypothetical protein
LRCRRKFGQLLPPGLIYIKAAKPGSYNRSQVESGRKLRPAGTSMWNAIVEDISPHLVAGTIMVAVMGVMFLVHRMYGGKDKPHDALEELKLRFARGEISREEYEERRKVLTA